jgi:hypothetical protein
MRKSYIFVIMFVFVFSTIGILFAEKITEPSTELQFEKIIKFSDEPGAIDVVCVGAGVRKKFVVKVYAGAVYLDPIEAKKVLGKYAPKTKPEDMEDFLEELAENSSYWNDFINGSFYKIIVMRFVRDVGSDKIIGAYKAES